jgi:hypothetical protein
VDVVNVLIAVIALVALVQFFLAYCHFLLLSSSRLEVSEEIQQLIQTESGAAPEPGLDDFQRLLQLARVCPFPGGNPAQVRAVRAYYFILKAMDPGFRLLVPGIAGWAHRELAQCCHFAAVALDRSVNATRLLLMNLNRNQP